MPCLYNIIQCPSRKSYFLMDTLKIRMISMRYLTRRRFIRQIAAAGAGTAILPLLYKVHGDEDDQLFRNKQLILTPPCLVKPAISSITVNIVGGDKPCEGFVRYMEAENGDIAWIKTESFTVNPYTPVNITLNHLKPGTSYKYQFQARLNSSDEFKPVAGGSFSTQKTGNVPFSFAMLSDSHITINEPRRIQILSDISKSILARRPSFLMMLGDNIHTFTSHGGPMTEERFGPALYYLLKQGLGDLPSSVPLYTLIGNWEGENGWHPLEQRAWARNARMAWMPNPLPDTYPEGGGEYGDYFGFTWGNAIFLSLTVTGYITIEHIHGSKVGRGDDWTLGDKQKAWLYKQLSESNAKWKFIFIHHTVSGKAGDDINTRYGRGGGQAAKIGEQKKLHEWMQCSLPQYYRKIE